MSSGEFIIAEEDLLDKTPMSAAMQDTVEVMSSQERLEAGEESMEEDLDLHVCGKCKAEFTNIQLYVDHKRVVCSKRSPVKTLSQESPKSKKRREAKQILNSTSAVTAIIEPSPEHGAFCETVIEEGVVEDDDVGPVEEAQREIIKAAKASEVIHQNAKQVREKNIQVDDQATRSEDETMLDGEAAGGDFKCTVCDKEFDRAETLVVHQFMHKKFHQCPDCKRSFVNEENLKKHQRDFKHVFKCKICLVEFGSQSVCKAHETSHTRQHECSDCKKKFYTEKNLERHREKVLHNLPCEHCGKICRDKHALHKHQESHTRIKSHLCDWEGCDRGFRSASEVAKHKKCVHLGIKEHKCTECGKEFARKDKLNRHLLIHSPNRPTYPCPFKTFTGCAKTFYRKDKLQRHIFAHSKEKPYKCETCCKLFARKDNLTEHTRIHTGEFKHRCPVCNKGMGGPKKLLLHVQLKHSGVNETIPEKPTMVETSLLPAPPPPSSSSSSSSNNHQEVATATADATAATWVQENMATEDKDDHRYSRQAMEEKTDNAEDCPEICEAYATERDEDDDQEETRQEEALTMEVNHVETRQPQLITQQQVQQQHKSAPLLSQSGATAHVVVVEKEGSLHPRQRARPPLHQPQQHLIQHQVPPTPPEPQTAVRAPPPLQQPQHTLQPQPMVVHSSQPATTIARVAVHYLNANSNNNGVSTTTGQQQPRGHYVPALHQNVPNVTQSETVLLHEVLSELATRSLFNNS